MNDVVEVSLCMGSSCFARGNNRLLEALEDFIQRNNLEGRVVLSGGRCRNKCGEGPIVTIDGESFQEPDAETLVALLRARLETSSVE